MNYTKAIMNSSLEKQFTKLCTSCACYKNTYVTYIIILMGKALENMQSEIINGSLYVW